MNDSGIDDTTSPRLESVWNYPRPPRLEPTGSLLRVIHQGIVLAETRHGLRVLETSHPPVYYFPPRDVRTNLLSPSHSSGSYCEFKGVASYWNWAPYGQSPISNVAWSYESPSRAYDDLRDYFAFYACRLDECSVDGERVTPQSGDFYGGWITSRIIGPFKGAPGSLNW